MRDIKFRCWQVEEFDDEDNPVKWQMIPADCLAFEKFEPLVDLLQSSEHEIFMQFTGLKDKNGKEIYEGDILCCPHYPANGTMHYLYHKVLWDERLSLFKTVLIGNKEGEEIVNHGNPMIWVYLKSEPEAEVIGNIYENPELVNQKQETY